MTVNSFMTLCSIQMKRLSGCFFQKSENGIEKSIKALLKLTIHGYLQCCLGNNNG